MSSILSIGLKGFILSEKIISLNPMKRYKNPRNLIILLTDLLRNIRINTKKVVEISDLIFKYYFTKIIFFNNFRRVICLEFT